MEEGFNQNLSQTNTYTGCFEDTHSLDGQQTTHAGQVHVFMCYHGNMTPFTIIPWCGIQTKLNTNHNKSIGVSAYEQAVSQRSLAYTISRRYTNSCKYTEHCDCGPLMIYQ